MSTARRGGTVDSGTVTITRDGRWYVALHEESGVASQGETQPEALANLAEALAMHEEPIEDDVETTEPDSPWL